MKRIITFFLLFLFLTFPGFAQNQKTGSPQVKWAFKNPFQHDVFIENKGQFSDKEKTAVGESIMYYTRKGTLHLYFSKQSIIFRYDSVYSLGEKTNSTPDDDKNEFERNLKVKHLFFEINFKNSNPDAQIDAVDPVKDYFTYGNPQDKPGKSGIIAHGWKKLIYRNIYPGIDIEFYYPEEKGGLEYNITVHPGADVSVIKMQYSSNVKLALSENNALISAPFMKLTDHAPKAQTQDFADVKAKFELYNNIVSFKVGDYDKNKTLLIDPWITTPLFTGAERVYDLDCDLHGNIYIYGGETPYYVEKLTSSGSILWTYTSSFTYTYATDFSFYGGMTVDGHSGSSFISEGYDANGGQMRKINTLGVEVAAWSGNSNYQELWRLEYNSCQSQGVIIGGGTTANSYQTCNFDTLLLTMNPVQTVVISHLDLAMGALDNVGNCYIMSSTNELIKAPLASLNTLTYEVASGYSTFTELASIYYVYTYGHYFGAGANGFNGLAVNSTSLYGYDGATLMKWDPATGSQISSATVYSTPFQSGGLTVDDCNHLFLGNIDSICQYDTNLNRVTAFVMPDTVYDLILSNGQLYACGPGYVAAANISIPNPVTATYTVPSSCSACDGTATSTVNCGSGPFNYLWSNGQTTQTATGLCAGIYTVTVQGFSCLQDTAVVNIPGKAGYSASVVDSNPDCKLSEGNITVNPTGGIAPYTYSWSNGETNQKDTGLAAGTYLCVITDSAGCKYTISATLENQVNPRIYVNPGLDSICSGSSLSLTASGVSTYTWTPNSGLSCYNCSSPTATPTVTTTYTVSGIDTNGCTAMSTVTIKVYATPYPVITGQDSICPRTNDTLTVIGGTTYQWSNGYTTSTIVVAPAVNRTFTVTAFNGPCSHDTTFTIYASTPAAIITASKDSICSGDTVTLEASGGYTYLWSTKSTSTRIVVSPHSDTTYTLYSSFGTCQDSATVEINLIKPISASINSSPDSVCPNSPVTLSIIPSGGIATKYKWNTGATSSTITVTPSVTTTYSATAFGQCDSVLKTITVIVVPPPVALISGTSIKCYGMKDTLIVTGGTKYLWSNGSTKTTYYTGNINSDSTITVVAYNSLGCSDTVSFTVTVLASPLVNVQTSALKCPGQPVLLTATATGTGPFTYLWTPGGKTTDTITVTPDTTTNYVIMVSNGCKNSKTITVTPDYPTLFACCSTTILLGDDTIITASGLNIISYQWIPATGLNCDTCQTVTATPTVTTTYTVTGTDNLGCQVERIVTIVVETACFDFIVPNVFTPDFAGTGALGAFDKVLYIKTENLSAWSITIYDRWGKEMFKSTDPDAFWDGNTEGGSKAPDGVYYYIISATCQNNAYKKDGFVQVIR